MTARLRVTPSFAKCPRQLLFPSVPWAAFPVASRIINQCGLDEKTASCITYLQHHLLRVPGHNLPLAEIGKKIQVLSDLKSHGTRLAPIRTTSATGRSVPNMFTS